MDPLVAETTFHHERLDVYLAALDLVALAHDVIDAFPRGRSSLADQLERAATSVAFNIAEGAGEFSAKEKVRFYRMALRSAAECGAILDVCERLSVLCAPHATHGRELLKRIAAMLTALVRRQDGA